VRLGHWRNGIDVSQTSIRCWGVVGGVWGGGGAIVIVLSKTTEQITHGFIILHLTLLKGTFQFIVITYVDVFHEP